MIEYFKLISVYEAVFEFKTNTRPVRIEILRSIDNPKRYRARVWDQHTYNLYPTFANMQPSGGIENKLMSCDEINREITTIVTTEQNCLILGSEWDDELDYLDHIKLLVKEYYQSLGGSA